ncbi:DUF4435 domain-containing protein [Chryseobacterium sp. SSA4.19]|uniref:DUF4435 domain-containing protein n=1 Tax=Chryseobacterium sp. SSA4.19 TaxID=2919915 RepID=UPI001F4D5712|nr:DUF4435 domain-containing protein [Chryseobacterium sp. SSA4.19]MCJ8155767.1 DUF4435 domain-containing protein [Chryseobacterium sp. SSA4.19]
MALTVEDLKREREEATSVAYQKFVLLTSSKENSLFCFFENKDAPYYHLRIKANFNGDFQYISCGNKAMVKKAYKLIKNHKEYNKYKLAFFIDKDFDESIKNQYSEIYETPSYSIENLYCSTNAFKEFIKTDLQIGEDEPLHNEVLTLYESLLADFLNASLLFNAWYKLQKKIGEEQNTYPDINLSNSLIPTFIDMTLESVNSNYNIDSILQKYPNHFPFTQQQLDDEINNLKSGDLRLILRGKYIFNFMTSFIRQLIENGADPKKRTVLTRKIKYNMDNSTALTLLTCYADSPNCLEQFISKYN